MGGLPLRHAPLLEQTTQAPPGVTSGRFGLLDAHYAGCTEFLRTWRQAKMAPRPPTSTKVGAIGSMRVDEPGSAIRAPGWRLGGRGGPEKCDGGGSSRGATQDLFNWGLHVSRDGVGVLAFCRRPPRGARQIPRDVCARGRRCLRLRRGRQPPLQAQRALGAELRAADLGDHHGPRSGRPMVTLVAGAWARPPTFRPHAPVGSAGSVHGHTPRARNPHAHAHAFMRARVRCGRSSLVLAALDRLTSCPAGAATSCTLEVTRTFCAARPLGWRHGSANRWWPFKAPAPRPPALGGSRSRC